MCFAKKNYPPKGGKNALSRWGPLDGLSNLSADGEQKLSFLKDYRKSALFEIPKTFIPRREMRSISSRGPIEGLSNLYSTGERKWFQKHQRKSTFFESSKNFIVRMGG